MTTPPRSLACGTLRALLAAALALGHALGAAAEPAHPLLAGAGGADERLLGEFTDQQWLALIPRQSPRKAAGFAALGRQGIPLEQWSWDPRQPDRLTCPATGEVYPDAGFPVLRQVVEVLSGKSVEIPYVETGGGAKRARAYPQACIDYHKILFLEARLARLGACYAGTRDERYARIAAMVLDEWATAIPDYFIGAGNPGLPPIPPREAEAQKWFVCRVSTYNALAHEWPHLALAAFDCIYDSKALAERSGARGYDVCAHIAADFFGNIADVFVQRIRPEWAIRTNLSLPYMVLADAATILGRPGDIAYLDGFLAASIAENFKRDGMFPESFTYHRGYAGVNEGVSAGVARYFAHRPADSDALRAIAARCAERSAFLHRSATAHFPVCYPDGLIPPFGDSAAARDAPRSETRSALLPAYGHLALGGGAGAQQSQVNLGWGDFNNHCQDDVLGLTLYACGAELIGNNRYDRGPSRAFNNHTLGHNTVLIDRESQPRRGADALATSGNLVLYEPGADGIAIAELDGARAYPGKAERYQRLVVMNTVDPSHPYLLDLFAVVGGTTHDYVLHGATTFAETASCGLATSPMAGDHPLLVPGEQWREPAQGAFPVYGMITRVVSGHSTGDWDATFRGTDRPLGTRVLMVDGGGQDVYLGSSPVLGSGGEEPDAGAGPARARRPAAAAEAASRLRPTLLARHQGSAGATRTLFIAVLEPLSGRSAITSCERLPTVGDDPDAVAVRIRSADGREDVVLADLDDPAVTGCPGRAREIATRDGGCALQGRIGVCVRRAGLPPYAKAVGAARFRCGDQVIAAPVHEFTGTVTAAERRADGAADDVLVTSADLPAGDALRGTWLSLVMGTWRAPDGRDLCISEQFHIARVERLQGLSRIHMAEDPCLQVAAGTITEIMRPHRAFVGRNAFRIEVSAIADAPR